MRKGSHEFELPTVGFAEEQSLNFVAQLPQDNVAVAANVTVAVRAFRIDLGTNRDVYLDGETFTLDATTLDAQGKPAGEALRLSVLKRIERNGNVSENEVQSIELKTDPKTGKGNAAVTIEDEEGGSYTLRVAGTDRFGNPVVSDRMVTISGKKDETKLRILADTQQFKVGDKASLRIHNRGKAGPALVTWEGDRILSYKAVMLKEGENTLEWEVDGAQFPNFTLTASRMVETRFDDARIDLRIDRDLKVTIKPVKEARGSRRSGGGRSDDRRSTRSSCRGRGLAGLDRPGAVAAARRSLAVDRFLLLQPEPHRCVFDGIDEHVPI